MAPAIKYIDSVSELPYGVIFYGAVDMSLTFHVYLDPYTLNLYFLEVV